MLRGQHSKTILKQLHRGLLRSTWIETRPRKEVPDPALTGEVGEEAVADTTVPEEEQDLEVEEGTTPMVLATKAEDSSTGSAYYAKNQIIWLINVSTTHSTSNSSQDMDHQPHMDHNTHRLLEVDHHHPSMEGFRQSTPPNIQTFMNCPISEN